METKGRHLTTYGNLSLVQIEVRPDSNVHFKPGEPEIKNGGLEITELTSYGIVEKLVAENNTGSLLLLTDADVLVGAKQNRILNKSVLLAPFSKTILDVSCIERRRWYYTTNSFSAPPTVADHDLRKDKAKSIAFRLARPDKEENNTQSEVWSHINSRMKRERFESVTESYSDMICYCLDANKTKFPVCKPEKGCNGLAVLIDKKIVCIDLFGNEVIYNHYFPRLRDSAFLRANTSDKNVSIDGHEAYFKVLDLLDNYEKADRNQDKEYQGAGTFFITDNMELVGFNLNYESQIIHNVLFIK